MRASVIFTVRLVRVAFMALAVAAAATLAQITFQVPLARRALLSFHILPRLPLVL
jgi:hypothetical protein